MSHYKNYLKEAFDKECFEDDDGYVVYYKLADSGLCYIEEIYVAPAVRGSGKDLYFENKAIEWAKENKCNGLLGSVNLGLSTKERSMVCLIKAGYKYSHTSSDRMYFTKGLL